MKYICKAKNVDAALFRIQNFLQNLQLLCELQKEIVLSGGKLTQYFLSHASDMHLELCGLK